ncbi:MAG: hypothetical protein GX589_06260 [Deltaproteobacteria bacterium]|nr:hypothetical protein [Deltaproteobacteria bacterium]
MVAFDFALTVELIAALLTALYIAKLLVLKGEIDRLYTQNYLQRLLILTEKNKK